VILGDASDDAHAAIAALRLKVDEPAKPQRYQDAPRR